MLKNKISLYQTYHVVLTIALTWSLLLGINEYCSFHVFILILAFYAIIPAFLIHMFDLYKKHAISYVLMGCILTILLIMLWIGRSKLTLWFQTFIQWCKIYNGDQELYIPGYAHSILIVTAFFSAVLFYLLMKKLVSRIILAVVFLTLLIIISVTLNDISKVAVCTVIFYILMILSECYATRNNRRFERPERKEGILYLAPVCFLIAFLSVMLPSKADPLEWKVFRVLSEGINDQLDSWATKFNYHFGHVGKEFSLRYIGYSEDSDLGSGTKLVEDNIVALKISGLTRYDAIYLTGSVSDIYTGSSWEKSRADYLSEERDYVLDNLELYYALARQDRSTLQDNGWVRRNTVEIRYHNIITSTFFYPLKMENFEFYSHYNKLVDATPQINFLKAQGKNTDYKLTYYEMNLAGDNFQQMLRAADSFTYQQPLTINDDVKKYVDENILNTNRMEKRSEENDYKLLAKRATIIHNLYTKLPDQVPERVYTLAKEITKDCHTDYDKCRAIEHYLSTNYSYSSRTPKLPKGREFIDYFLFEGKSGYCTSFATAAAVLGRCVGIPTRYVEGFAGKANSRDKKGWYLIKNSRAHAWAEVYMNGVGWIPLEPTPNMYQNRYEKWKTVDQSGTNEMKDTEKKEGINPSVILPQRDRFISGNGPTNIFLYRFVIIIAIIMILFLILLSYYFLLKRRYWKNYSKADNNRKLHMIYLRILSQLQREGFELQPQETVKMLSKRVKDRYCYENVLFEDVTESFMRYRYADKVITTEELKQAESFYQGLTKREKSEENPFRVLVREFVYLSKGNIE